MGEFFYRLHLRLSKNKTAAGVFALILILGMIFFVSKIRFEEDISKLIPVSDENRELQKVLKTVNFSDQIVVNIQREKGGTVEELVAFASDLTDSLEHYSGKYIKHIRGKVGSENLNQTMDFVYENLPLFLDEKDYTQIEKSLSADSIAAVLEADYRALIAPSGIVSRDIILKDPLGLSFLALKKLRQLGVSENFVLKNGFLISSDENNILLFITPQFAGSETAENSEFAGQLYKFQEELNLKYSEKISVSFFGAALIAVANAKQIKQDIQFTVGITLILLVLIFIFYYKRVYIPFILFIPTLFGGLLGLFLLYLIRDEISAVSLGIGSVLIGVTLDYSLHILTHIRNNQPVEVVYKEVARPVLMSSLTTGMAFLCLLFMDSRAIQDLGIMAAASVLGASVFALCFIPLAYRNPELAAKKTHILDKIGNFRFHSNPFVLAGIGILLIVSMFTYSRTSFDKDITRLNYEPKEQKLALEKLDELTDLASKSIYLATYGGSVENTLQTNDLVFEKLEKLREEKVIESFNSVGALVHSQKKQQEKIDRWNQFWNSSRKRETVDRIISEGSKIGFKDHSFGRFFDFLDKKFHILEPESYQQLPAVLLEDFISARANFTTISTLVKLEDEQIETVKKVFEEFPGTVVIDRQEMNETFLGNLKNDFHRLIFYCFGIVVGILILFFRNIAVTLLTVLPIFLTWILTVGLMGILNLNFNIFNIVISTFIFGLCIDYSIFMTKGMFRRLRTGEEILPVYKVSIMLSVLTTILGIGVLIFAKHPALYSVSAVSVLAIFSAMLISFSIQPLLFGVLAGSNTMPATRLRVLLHSVFSFGYFGLGGIVISLISIVIMPVLPVRRARKKEWFHYMVSKFLKSVYYTNPFVKKTIINEVGEDFSKPAVIIANHTSFLDILAIGMLHPKISFMVSDWVYNSPVFGRVVRYADFYPASQGVEASAEILKEKIDQGYSLMVFPEGTRSTTNKVRRFHKGAFYLAEMFNLDILPVMIHGNSEINPKGSFIIRDGAVTIKILNRISPSDFEESENYSQKTREVQDFFRSEFLKFRKECEDPDYFHDIVLREYRHKGEDFYKPVKSDLKNFEFSYYQIMQYIGKEAVIAHFSEDWGQLDFLLMLDGPDREITSLIEEEAVRNMLNFSYLTQKYRKLNFASSFSEFDLQRADVLILNSEKIDLRAVNPIQNSIHTLILLKGAVAADTENILKLGYKTVVSNTFIRIFEYPKLKTHG